MKEQLVYKLTDVDADDGVDIFAIAPVLMQFGELVRSANAALDYGLDIDVRVKPFREGSWITEFVLQGSITQTLLSVLRTPEGQDLTMLLAFLGLGAKDGISGLAKVVRFTAGKVANFRKNTNNTITYVNDSGEELTVSMPEHQLVQSPVVQVNYYNSLIVPLDKFPAATAVSISIGNDANEVQRFTLHDKEAFDEYSKAELIEEAEENVSQMHGVFVKPKRGPYSGQEQQFSFIMGENVLYPVCIEDEEFLDRMRSGDIRPYSEDVLKVDLEVRQKRDVRNKITGSYAITKVIEYIKYEKPKQYSLDDFRSDGDS